MQTFVITRYLASGSAIQQAPTDLWMVVEFSEMRGETKGKHLMGRLQNFSTGGILCMPNIDYAIHNYAQFCMTMHSVFTTSHPFAHIGMRMQILREKNCRNCQNCQNCKNCQNCRNCQVAVMISVYFGCESQLGSTKIKKGGNSWHREQPW